MQWQYAKHQRKPLKVQVYRSMTIHFLIATECVYLKEFEK